MRILRFSGLALIVACGGADGGLFDSGTDDAQVEDATNDNTVVIDSGGNDVTVTDATSGDASDASDASPIEAGPLCLQTPCITQIASGGYHSCARVTDGSVRCWGRNNVGQLGVGILSDGGFDPTAHPAPINPQLASVSQITASHYSMSSSVTCVLAGGVPMCFGANTTGQLGLAADAGIFDNNAHPDAAAVQGLPSSVSSVWAGNLHSCAIDGTGAMFCWGYDQQDQLGRPAPGVNGNVLPAVAVQTDAGPATQMGPGYDYSIGLTKAGTVYSWGANGVGELGRTGTSPPAPLTLTGVTNIAAGLQHACAVASGALSCWGNDQNAELGDGKQNTQSATPVAVNVASKTITQVTAGYSHTCALATDGTVYCWGQNDWGQCATGLGDAGFNNNDVLTPTQVQLTGKVLQVEAGTNHTCALIVGGSVMCWGANDRGQLGQGLIDASLDTNAHPTPVTVKFQ
jgi:alpha-tubulin suppressor-like RCC1 family protein